MDDLTQITGIGKATADRLVAAGITTFQQLAHDAVAGENGVKAEWIAAAAASLPQRPEARPDASGAPKGTGSPSASADPAGDAPEGTNFTDTPPSDDAGGAGDPASPAGGDNDDPFIEEALEKLALEVFRQSCPKLAAAVQAWRDANPETEDLPLVRIASRRDGFRGCNVAHSKAATDHPFTRFDPAELERLLAEPILTVELV
jgi:hypothetical protein